MEAAIQATLAVFMQIAQATGTSAATEALVASVVEALIKLIPIVVKLVPSLIQTVESVIAALEASDATVPDQIAKLRAQLPADDADFADAVKTAEVNDAAADAADAQLKP